MGRIARDLTKRNQTIRRAGPDDVENITRIYVESWNLGFGSRMPVIEADPDRIGWWWKDLGNSTRSKWWVAERSNQIEGFVGICPSRDPIDPNLGEVDTIAVDPVVWRTGVGKSLMSVALDALRSDGYRSAVVWTLKNYPQGENFYVTTGWKCSGVMRSEGQHMRYDRDLSHP